MVDRPRAAADPALEAAGDLLASAYGELRRLAEHELRGAARPETLQATALVHEAWLRLRQEGRASWESRAQFFVAAGTAMRRVLVDRARARGRLKRGGSWGRIVLVPGAHATAEPDVAEAHALLELDLALDDLLAFDPSLARLVELRAFTGLTEAEAALVLRRSERAVRRDWRAARMWLYSRILELRRSAHARRLSRAL